MHAATSPEPIMARAATENFPVASRLLPPSARRHLLAIYGFARLVDELGDEAPGDRLAARAGADDRRLRALARAVRAADRSQPRRPARPELRDMGGPPRLLPPLGRS